MGKVLALGLMSGTSLDGIDVALIETDGADAVEHIAGSTYPYSPEFRGKLRQAIGEAGGLRARFARPGILALAEQYLTDLHAEAVAQFLADRQLPAAEIAVIGFHGQTVLHRPAARLTVQLGDGRRLAKATGIDVVYDLRAADVAAGGQGAPLVPVYHQALARAIKMRPLAVLNIGGVANLTYIGSRAELVAFDTGPGNALIDDFMRARAGAAFDPDGMQAAQGIVHDDRVSHYLRHSFFASAPPKSLDRNAFPLELMDGLSVADGAATLTAFTATAIARAREHLPAEPQLWVICGGGRRNRTLMSMIAARVENAVVPAEAVGLNGDFLEAEAWAYLAVRSTRGLPVTFPGTTGVLEPLTGGVLARAR